MDILIQIIETKWTKKSRGNPKATLRNSVPNNFDLYTTKIKGISLQKVFYFESNDFKKPYIEKPKEINENQLREIRLELIEKNNFLEIKFWGTPIRPSYIKAKSIAFLQQNSWFQIIGNARIPYEDTTGYIKYVFNIFYGEQQRANEVIYHSKPVNIYNEEVNLL